MEDTAGSLSSEQDPAPKGLNVSADHYVNASRLIPSAMSPLSAISKHDQKTQTFSGANIDADVALEQYKSAIDSFRRMLQPQKRERNDASARPLTDRGWSEAGPKR